MNDSVMAILQAPHQDFQSGCQKGRRHFFYYILHILYRWKSLPIREKNTSLLFYLSNTALSDKRVGKKGRARMIIIMSHYQSVSQSVGGPLESWLAGVLTGSRCGVLLTSQGGKRLLVL